MANDSSDGISMRINVIFDQNDIERFDNSIAMYISDSLINDAPANIAETKTKKTKLLADLLLITSRVNEAIKNEERLITIFNIFWSLLFKNQ